MPQRAHQQRPERVRRPWMGTRRDRRWQAGVWLLLLVGVSLSVAGAYAWHAKLQSADRAAFRSRASDLAITVGSGLNRDTDFVASLRSLVATTPHLDDAGFVQAILGVDAAQRYPGGIGYAYFERVTAAGLKPFEAQLAADPPSGQPVTDYRITPAGARASYCLQRFGSATAPVAPVAGFPLGLDICAPGGILGVGDTFLEGASAQNSVVLIQNGVVGIGAPVYSGGVTPTTAAGRQAAFSGWIAGTFASAGLLPASRTDSGMQVQVLFRNAGSQPVVVAQSGPAPRGQVVSQSLEVNADGQWTVRIAGVPTGAGSSWAQGGAVLAALLLICVMLFGLLQVLIRSGRRALRLVDERTGQLNHQALHDTLTGLPNRALILDRAQQMLVRGRRDLLPMAALFMDLDGFKDVNDTYGHDAGDRLLQAVAERITATLRQHETAGRLGGDEFVVLVEGTAAQPEIVAERLLAVLREPFLLDQDRNVSVTAQTSIGIAIGDRENAGDLLRDADLALYQAKYAGGNQYAVFSPDMQTAARDRVELTMELRGALAAGEFFLAYQPTFSLRDMTVTGVEALIRWRHPGRGVVPPDDFIPIAEDTGLIIPIGRWVLQTACAEAATWQSPERRLSIAVNVSGRQLDSDVLVADVRAALDQSGLDADLLTLEITETALMHDAVAGAARLKVLKALGVRIAIDDFGTGYSSLTYLQQFSADALKIDRSFIAAMADSPESVVIVRTLVQLGKALGIETLAEGIEERDQLEHLQQQDCDSGQGFLFARPLSLEALQKLITPAPGLMERTSP